MTPEVRELLEYARAHLQQDWENLRGFLPGTEDERKRDNRRLMKNVKAALAAGVPACLCGQPISDECRANGCRWDREKEHG